MTAIAARTTADERGSATIEAVIGLPAFMLFVVLIIFGGRTAITHSTVESAAADAARSASIARNGPEGKQDAQLAARASLSNQEIACVSVDVTIDTGVFATRVGAPGSVEVTVRCRLDLSDLSAPGIPGQRVITATMSSPVDTWRQRS